MFSLRPQKKQDCFDLTKDLGDTSPLPNDLAHFLEDVNEQIDAPCLPAPLSMSSLRCHDTPTGEVWTKIHSTMLSKPTSACQTWPRCRSTPDSVEHPGEWFHVDTDEHRWLPSWQWEFRSLYKEFLDGLTDDLGAVSHQKTCHGFQPAHCSGRYGRLVGGSNECLQSGLTRFHATL